MLFIGTITDTGRRSDRTASFVNDTLYASITRSNTMLSPHVLEIAFENVVFLDLKYQVGTEESRYYLVGSKDERLQDVAAQWLSVWTGRPVSQGSHHHKPLFSLASDNQNKIPWETKLHEFVPNFGRKP
jgi:hypothetical protein